MNILLVDSAEPTLALRMGEAAKGTNWNLTRAANYAQAAQSATQGEINAVVVSPPQAGACIDLTAYENLMRVLDSSRIATLVVCNARPQTSDPNSLIANVSADISPAELRGRLAMIDRYHAVLQKLEHELHNMERLSKRLNLQFRDIDQEMRLAGRLQRDFLPSTRDPIGNLRFASVFRPASWVSGDMFDIFRIDEAHSGIYIADAVGHGMAAGLLTMFIKRAITPKRIDAHGYSVLGPSEIIASLNDALAEQSLPQCQFVTACYALFNHETLRFEYARGGHPYPILITCDGIVSEIKAQGGLLGLFKGEQFPLHQVQLRKGDKIVFYTDGIEFAFASRDPLAEATSALIEFLQHNSSLSVAELMHRMEEHLDRQDGSLHPRDDISLIGLEVIP